MHLGIDLGTTRTVVALADRGNYPVLTFTDSGLEWFPSVAAVREGEWRFGFDALGLDDSWRVVRSFKRLLGGSDAMAAADLVTGFLRALRTAILERSNLPEALKDEPLRAVVAVPANAHGTQRMITLDAFRRAGFDVVAMLNEPSAAGFEYTHRYRNTVTSKRDHVVVYDLGGGTFDASLLSMRDRHHEVVATAGANRLGGDDFDEIMARMIPGTDALGERDWARLLDACREAKEALTPNTRRIVVGDAIIPAADYHAACAPLVEKTLSLLEPLDRGDVAGIYVVGGASAHPVVARVLREKFGRRVHRSPYPHASIAIGLAIAADDRAGLTLEDRFSRSFGVFREARAGRDVAFDPIFAADTRLPARGAATTLRRTYRAAHNIGHYRFVECTALGQDGAPQGDVTPMGEVIFPFDAATRETDEVRRTDAGPLVEEEYSVDAHGIVHVTVRNLDAGYEKTFQLGI